MFVYLLVLLSACLVASSTSFLRIGSLASSESICLMSVCLTFFHIFESYMVPKNIYFVFLGQLLTVDNTSITKSMFKKICGCKLFFGFQVILISGNSIPYKHVDSHGERSFALIAFGQPLPSPTIFELKLDTKVFVSRVNMDLKISYCEGR